jgi:chromosome segregation ATPase
MEQREQRISYAEVFEAFPSELRLPIVRLVDALKVEFEVPRTDFTDLKTAVQGLAEAQARTEARMEELAAAQVRTEARMEELAAAQVRTEARVEELGTAQTRTEARVDRLAVAVEELAQAQKRTEHELAELAQAQARTQEEVTLFRRAFMSQIGGLGARWGLQTGRSVSAWYTDDPERSGLHC